MPEDTVLSCVSDLIREQLVEDDAVGFIHLDLLRGHDECLLLNIDLEESHSIRFMALELTRYLKSEEKLRALAAEPVAW